MFIYTIVNIGSEKLLKEEMMMKYPEFRPSYSRPGFITFKNIDETKLFRGDIELDLIFARKYGISLGKYNKEEIEERIDELKYGMVVQRFSPDCSFAEGVEAKLGEEILDVVVISENEYWLGMSKYRKFSWGVPGGNPLVVKPVEAPSRAYTKLEEAMRWCGYNWGSGEIAFELGSAPGGASYSLLKRGFTVFGVDAAEMSKICLDYKKFTDIKLSIQRLEDNNIPSKIDVLLCDVNLAPSVMLPQIRKIFYMRSMIKKIFFTMKIGASVSMEHIPEYMTAIKKIGFKTVKATQLPSNHSEIFIYASR